MTFRGQILKGLRWTGTLRVFVKLLTLLKLIVLARILSPEAFGQFGIAVLVLSFFETLTETGVNQMLIFSSRKIEELLDSAWIVSIVRGVVISILIAISAFPLGWYFHDAGVVHLAFLIALAPLVRGFVNPMVVTFVKELDFRKEFWFRSTSAVVDLIAVVTVGIFTHSAVAFIAGLLFSAMSDLVLSFTVVTIRPRFRFLRSYFSEIIGYGKWITFSGVASWLASELDDFIVGRLYGASSLGVYQGGYKIATLPVIELSGAVNTVSFPVLSKVRGDRMRLRRVFLTSVLATTALGFIAAVTIWLFPALIVRTVLGPGWDAVIPVVRVLALFGALRTLESSVQPLFLSTGRPDIPSVGNVLKVVMLIAGLLLFAREGVNGVAVAALFSVLFVIPYYLLHIPPLLRK